MNKNKSICPVCGNDQIKTLALFSSADVAQHLVLEEKETKYNDIIKQVELLWEDNHCEICACSNCNFEFASPFVAGDKLFYSTVYSAEIEYPDWKWEYQRSYNFIENLIQNGNFEPTLLEIGAGNGAFLKRVADKLLNKKNVYATEYSEKGLEKMLQDGIQCYQKSIFEIQQEKLVPRCDIICMFQVLEHLSDIQNIFSTLNAITKENAFLVIAVPNPLQRKYFDLNNIFLDIPPIHIGRYFKETFTMLGEQFRWKIVDLATQPQSYKEKVMKFIFDRYNRANYAAQVAKQKNKLTKTLLKYSFLGYIVVLHIKIILHLRSKQMGTSQWLIMQKTAAL